MGNSLTVFVELPARNSTTDFKPILFNVDSIVTIDPVHDSEGAGAFIETTNGVSTIYRINVPYHHLVAYLDSLSYVCVYRYPEST